MKDNNKRSKRLASKSYAISWIGKTVNCPRGQTGIVRKADRNSCSVEMDKTKVINVYKKSELTLYEDQPSESHFPKSEFAQTSEQFNAYQDNMKRYVSRQRERFRGRPNLREWLIRIETHGVENGAKDEADEQIVDLIIIHHCNICNMEKETIACWNEKCPASPLFCKQEHEKQQVEFSRMGDVPLPCPTISFNIQATKKYVSRKRRRISIEGTALPSPSVCTDMDGSVYRWKQRSDESYPSTPVSSKAKTDVVVTKVKMETIDEEKTNPLVMNGGKETANVIPVTVPTKTLPSAVEKKETFSFPKVYTNVANNPGSNLPMKPKHLSNPPSFGNFQNLPSIQKMSNIPTQITDDIPHVFRPQFGSIFSTQPPGGN